MLGTWGDAHGSVFVWREGPLWADWSHIGPIWALAFGDDATGRSWLASGGRDGVLRYADALTHEPNGILTRHEGQIAGIAALTSGSGDAWFLSAGADGVLRLSSPAVQRVFSFRIGSAVHALSVYEPYVVVGGRDHIACLLIDTRELPSSAL